MCPYKIGRYYQTGLLYTRGLVLSSMICVKRLSIQVSKYIMVINSFFLFFQFTGIKRF